MTNRNKTTLALVLTVAVVGCVKQRPAAFPDGQGEGVMSRELLEKSQITITTASTALLSSGARGGEMRATEAGRTQTIARVEAPDSLKALFTELTITGRANTSYPVILRTDENHVTGYKVVTDTSELTPIEDQISNPARLATAIRGAGHMTSGRLVPIFQYAVSTYGKLVRAKNDLGEETSNLRIQASDWSAATHLQITPVASARKAIPQISDDSRRRLFIDSKVNQKLLANDELRAQLQLSVAESGQFRLNLDNNALKLFMLVNTTSPLLKPEQKAVANAVRLGNARHPQLLACGAADVAALGSADCVQLLAYEFPIRHQRARLVTTNNEPRLITADAMFEVVSASAGSPLIYLAENMMPIDHLNQQSAHDARKILPVALKKDQFLFRRTLQDSPNTFEHTFPGIAGDLEIVRFVFDHSRVRVIRADALLPGTNASEVDREVLLSVPAVYFKDIQVDEQGNPLAIARTVPSSNTDESAYAVVEWNQNSTPDISSPLSYYELGQCFAGSSEPIITDVDARLGEGLLSFSLSSSFSINPAVGCAQLYAGYMESVQSQFAFKERFSFKKYMAVNGERPLLAVPYAAQKQLGFGLFTNKRLTPNQYGNTGRIGTEKPLAALMDIQGGKQVTYVLAGIPSRDSSARDREIRERIIRATREVVADLNQAFRIALAGTTMERVPGADGDVVILKVEGDDIAAAQIGDLDRNFIYYVPKSTSAPILGLGGSSSNPRSGQVESASVFIYGGNLLGQVEGMKRVDQARREYAIASTPQPVPSPMPEEGEDRPSGPPGPPNSVSNLSLNLARIMPQGLPTIRVGQVNQTGSRWTSLIADRLSTYTETSSNLYLHKAVQAAIANREITDSRKLGRLVNEKFAEHAADMTAPDGVTGMDAQELALLKANSQRSDLTSKILERLQNANICVYEAGDLTRSSAFAGPQGPTDAVRSDIDYLVALYKPTLAHELGHNFGLRHNFISSYDKANFKFTANEATARSYSSIMDYLADDQDAYDGFGPHDVASLRSAYAGVLELSAAVLAGLSPAQLATLTAGKYMKLDTYLRAVGGQNWDTFTESMIERLPIKRYQFCSDEDAGWAPTCNRFDRGTTPSEIVDNVIADYRALYTIRNMPGDRIRFNWYDNGAYVGGLFGRLLPVRQFLEETIYQAVSGAPGAVINSYVEAAVKGLLFFHEIVRTPEAPAMLSSPGLAEMRFVDVQTQSGPVRVERKWTGDLGSGEASNRLQVRGIELDKVIALILLTERRFGFPRYERKSIRISYPEFERLVIRPESPLELPTIGLLTEILSDDIGPAVGTAKGLMPLRGAPFKVNSSEMIRTYGILGSILNLDVNGIETTDNLSSLFRVMSGFQVQRDMMALLQPGTSANNRTELRYWAADDALGSQAVVEQASAISAITEQKAALSEQIQKWVLKKLETSSAASPEAQAPLTVEYAAMTQALEEKLQKLPESVGIRKAEELDGLLTAIVKATLEIQTDAAEQPPMQTAYVIDEFNTRIIGLSKANPVLALALAALPIEALKIPLLPQLIAGTSLEMRLATLFSSAQTLNRIFYAVHPEYSRSH